MLRRKINFDDWLEDNQPHVENLYRIFISHFIDKIDVDFNSDVVRQDFYYYIYKSSSKK